MSRLEFIKVAIVSVLLCFMAYGGIFFKKFIGQDCSRTFPEYDKSCSCHNPNVSPDNQYTLGCDWVVKDLGVFNYGFILAIVCCIRADTRRWGCELMIMWIFYVGGVMVSYWISYETIIIAKYWFAIPCVIQIMYVFHCASLIDNKR